MFKNKAERMIALEGFFEAQGVDGIKLLEARNLLAHKWVLMPRLLRRDFQELTQTGVLTLKNSVLYHTQTLEGVKK